MEYVCEKSTISGGDSIKLQSPTFNFKGDLGSISIPMKIYKKSNKVMFQGGDLNVKKRLE